MAVNQCVNFCYLHSWCLVDAFSVASQGMGQTGLYREMNMCHKKRRRKGKEKERGIEGLREGEREGELLSFCRFHVLNEKLKWYLRINELKSSQWCSVVSFSIINTRSMQRSKNDFLCNLSFSSF